MDFECYADMTLDELYAELNDLCEAFNNESCWAAGSRTAADLNMHAQNAVDILNRIEYVRDLLGEEDENETLG